MVQTRSTLSPRQAAFSREYVLTGNATQAARDAGYVDNSNGSISVTANRLLSNAKVAADIQRRQLAIEIRTDYSVEMWRANVLADIEWARDQDNVAGVMKGHELLGRHLGALSNEQSNPLAAETFAFLAAWRARQTQAEAASQPVPLPEGQQREH